MYENELIAIFEQLEAEGWRPMLCDAEIPSYDRYVPCGDPTIVFEDTPDSFSFPSKMLSMHPEFTIEVMGDSMADAGLVSGDTVMVTCDDCPKDGDIVLASIDREITIKVYCEDEDGNPWLVPQNKRFKPIFLKDKTNVRIIGRVNKIIKNAPRVSYRECMKIIRMAKQENMKRQGITPEEVVNHKSDDGDDIVTQLLPIFYNKEKDVRLFLNQIQRMAPEAITDLVNQWVKEKRISDYGNSRKGMLWGILHEVGLYTRTVQNWNRRVD